MSLHTVTLLAYSEIDNEGAEVWSFDVTRSGHAYYTADCQLAARHVGEQTGRRPDGCRLAVDTAKTFAGRPFTVRPMQRPETPPRRKDDNR